jgi:hypothetical protein
MNNELEKIRKKSVVTYSRYYLTICLEVLRKTMKNSVKIASVLAEIWGEGADTWLLPYPRFCRKKTKKEKYHTLILKIKKTIVSS